MAPNSKVNVARPNAWAVGLALFAGIMMIVGGGFAILQGIAALANGDFYVSTANYTFDMDVTLWGWTHILLGTLLLLVGIGVVTGNLLARIMGLFVVVLVMFDNFLFIPYYPFWSLLLIGLNVLILWALATAPAADLEI